MLLQYFFNAFINGSIIAIIAFGFALVYNTTRIFHIAYAALFSVAGYLFYQFFELWHWHFAVSLLLAVISTALISVLCEVIVYRPMLRRKMGPNPMMIASVGMLIILDNVLVLIWGNSPLIVSQISVFETDIPGISDLRLAYFAVYALLIIALMLFFSYSNFLKILRAVRDNNVLSQVLGYNVMNVRIKIFAFSGMIVGLAGALNSYDVGVSLGVGLPYFIYAFIALIIGGIGRWEGPVLGGFVIGIVQTATGYFINSQWVVLSIFVVLLMFLLYKPEGLLPERRREL